jgi:hypothetical protein
MREGELWWFDNKQPHDSVNASDEWRIHVIFDIKARHVSPDEWRRDKLSSTVPPRRHEGYTDGSVQFVPPLVHMPAISLT